VVEDRFEDRNIQVNRNFKLGKSLSVQWGYLDDVESIKNKSGFEEILDDVMKEDVLVTW
jgi:hypothetical protein